MNKWFGTLRGSKLTEREQRCGLYLGALTPLSDDLTDDHNLASGDILTAWDNRSDNFSSAAIVAGRFLYNKLLENANDTFAKYSALALAAQDESMLQSASEILDEVVLRKITWNKGASSTLLGRSMLSNSLEAGEETAINELGFLLQLTNDVFDVYKDRENKQQTLLTNDCKLSQLLQLFTEGWKQVNHKFLQLNYQKKDTIRFLSQVSTILARGELAFRQLSILEKKSGGVFRLPDYSRQQLICDMEKPANLRASLLISVKKLSAL